MEYKCDATYQKETFVIIFLFPQNHVFDMQKIYHFKDKILLFLNKTRTLNPILEKKASF